jgi:predicted PilT family ATPase
MNEASIPELAMEAAHIDSSFIIDTKYLPYLIGIRGRTVRAIERESETKIRIPRKGTPQNTGRGPVQIWIAGNEVAVSVAKQSIRNIVGEFLTIV